MLIPERKLRIPDPAPDALLTAQADRLLQQALSNSLLLIHAPAGYGKTSLLAQWVQQKIKPKHHVAWLSLDRRDTRPRRLAAGLVGALRGLDSNSDSQWQNWLENLDSDDPHLLLEAIEGQLESLNASVVLVLDDVHLLKDSPALDLLNFWLEALPEQFMLVLSARQLPDALPVARLRLRAELTEMGPEHLSWGESELKRFFAKFNLTSEQLKEIQTASQGWALACQLLKMQLNQGQNADTAIAQLGQHRALEDYLQQEVLPFLEPQALDLLTKSSILNDLTPELCALLSPNGPALDTLARQFPFLTPIDRSRHWYVCHPLLRDWLQQRLSQTQRFDLHSQAARYFMAQHSRDLALEHALAAQNTELLADVLDFQARSLLGLGKIQTLAQAFAMLPESVLRQRPGLALYQIWIWLLTGQSEEAQTWINWFADGPVEHLTDGYGQLANLRATLGRRTRERLMMIEESRKALAIDSSDAFVPACAWFNLGLALMGLGEDWKAAEEAFQQAAIWNRRAGNLITHYAARVCQAKLYLRNGNLETARRAYQDIWASGRGESLQRHSLFGVVQLDLARIAHELDETDKRDTLISDGLALTKLSYNLDHVYGYVEAIRIYLDAREFVAAEELIAEAMQFAMQRKVEQLWNPLQMLRERQEILQGKRLKASSGDAWNQLYAALYSRDWSKSESALTALLSQHQGHLLERCRLETLMARLHEGQGDISAARHQLLTALTTAQNAPTLRALLDEASPALLAWLPGQLGQLKPDYRQLLLEALARRGFQPETEALSERERDLLGCLADGLNNKQMEERLFISQNTIKTHLKNLYRKLGVTSRTAAVARARDQGWL